MGYDQPDSVNYYGLSTIVWQKVMSNYLKDKTYKEFTMPDNIIPATYCKGSGLLAASYCSDTATGYYTEDDMPAYCNGVHSAGGLYGEKSTDYSGATYNYDDETYSGGGTSSGSGESTSSGASSGTNSGADSGAESGPESQVEPGPESQAEPGPESGGGEGGDTPPAENTP
jgi:penicillin-binding protein 1A